MPTGNIRQVTESVCILPTKCITSQTLHSLARALDRMAAFHREHGGAAPETPCLTEVRVEADRVYARVESGKHRYRLVLVSNDWEFR
jgi:hypothetical protein